jgi:hypothetical protein
MSPGEAKENEENLHPYRQFARDFRSWFIVCLMKATTSAEFYLLVRYYQH